MGIAYWCDKRTKITYAVWEGVITVDDWLRDLNAHMNDPEWLASRCWLTDQTHVSDSSALTLDVIARGAPGLIKMIRNFTPEQRAVVIAQESYDRAQMVMRFIARHGFSHTMVLYTTASACKLLGLDTVETVRIFNRLRWQLRHADGQSLTTKVYSLPDGQTPTWLAD